MIIVNFILFFRFFAKIDDSGLYVFIDVGWFRKNYEYNLHYEVICFLRVIVNISN
jgi:hypothetical protein